MSELDPQLDILREKTLRPVGNTASKLPKRKLTGFMAAKGMRYEKRGFMVVGRAVNGWSNSFNPSQLNASQECDSVSRKIKESVYDRHICPMEWVINKWQGNTDYNTKKSAFWRVTRQIVLSLSLAEDIELWPSYLAWSNLYKIAPEEGGNPGGRLRNVQLEGCRSLLCREIEDFQPSGLLFLTGWNWAKDFLIEKNIREVSGKFVEASGKLSLGPDLKICVVAAVHPQGKKEDEWVEEVAHEFNILCLQNRESA